MEKSERAKKLREQRKFGKKVSLSLLSFLSVFLGSRIIISHNFVFFQVQTEVLQKRQKEKKAMMTAVKKYQKGRLHQLTN